MKVELKGFRELDRALSELMTAATARNTLRRSGVAALTPMRDKAKSLAPSLTTTLRQNIIIQPSWDPKFNAEARAAFLSSGSAAGVKRQKGRISIGLSVVARAGTNLAKYAYYQEFGTQKMAASPYMRPAWHSEKNLVIGRLKVSMTDLVHKAVARAAVKRAKSA